MNSINKNNYSFIICFLLIMFYTMGNNLLIYFNLCIHEFIYQLVYIITKDFANKDITLPMHAT